MADATRTTTAAPVTRAGIDRSLLLPLWVAAISLAVIAVVLILASFSLLDALQTTQASVTQLQQQVSQLASGLGGLLGR